MMVKLRNIIMVKQGNKKIMVQSQKMSTAIIVLTTTAFLRLAELLDALDGSGARRHAQIDVTRVHGADVVHGAVVWLCGCFRMKLKLPKRN